MKTRKIRGPQKIEALSCYLSGFTKIVQTSATRPVPAVAHGIAILAHSGPIVFTIIVKAVNKAVDTPIMISEVRLLKISLHNKYIYNYKLIH